MYNNINRNKISCPLLLSVNEWKMIWVSHTHSNRQMVNYSLTLLLYGTSNMRAVILCLHLLPLPCAAQQRTISHIKALAHHKDQNYSNYRKQSQIIVSTSMRYSVHYHYRVQYTNLILHHWLDLTVANENTLSHHHCKWGLFNGLSR